jgi:hypothetical protein
VYVGNLESSPKANAVCAGNLTLPLGDSGRPDPSYITCAKPLKGRYLYITLERGGPSSAGAERVLGLCEVQVFHALADTFDPAAPHPPPTRQDLLAVSIQSVPISEMWFKVP